VIKIEHNTKYTRFDFGQITLDQFFRDVVGDLLATVTFPLKNWMDNDW